MFNQVIQPDTTIYLLKVPIEIDNDNQLTFANTTDQYNYFSSREKKILEKSTYQRENNIIRFNLSYDDVIEYNYVMYENKDKWIYAFITNVEYLSPNSTAIEITTDSFQTYQFDIVYKESFVEREHVNDDTVGLHTVPENVETGEYVVDEVVDLTVYDEFYICFMVTEYISPSTGQIRNSFGGIYGGVYSGLQYLVVQDMTNAEALMNIYASKGKSDAIINMFMMPKQFSAGANWGTQTIDGYTIYFGLVNSQYSKGGSSTYQFTTKPTSLNGYVPVNNKLLTYPFQFANLSNNVGTIISYRYEYFNSNYLDFTIDRTLTPSISCKVSPNAYKNLPVNYSESLPVAKIPACAWTTDLYTNWMTQNAVNIGVSYATAGLQVASGIGLMATGAGSLAGAGSIASGLTSIASTVGQIYQHSLIPPSAEGDVNSGDITFALGQYNPKLYKMCIKEEYARIIDNFFTMYGYKINRLKVPNITGRPNFNYVKTIVCNIIGDIPQARLQEIKDLFNRGITLWHNPNTFLDYSVPNK